MPQRQGAPGELVTVPGVELTRTGTHNASTGVVTFSREDFEAAVAASKDPDVWRAPVKIGHTDPRFASYDGDPAFGWVENLRVVDRGPGQASLFGDLVDVPAGFASIIQAAYRNRSIELAFGVKTASGQRYRAAVVGLALLGATQPAVAGLADVLRIYGADSTGKVAAAASDSQAIVVYAEAPPLTLEERVAALEGIGSPGGSAPVSHAARRDEPSPTGGGPVADLTPARIRELLNLEEGVDLEQALTTLRDSAAGAAPPGTTPPATPAAGSPVGTPAAAATPPAAGSPTPAAPATPAAVTPPATPAATPAAPAIPVAGGEGNPAIPDGFTLIDSATLQSVQGLITKNAETERETVLARAAREGRIAPVSITSWRQQYDRDPQGTVALLSALPQIFSTVELGHAEGGDVLALAAGGASDEAWDAFLKSLDA